MGIIELVAAEHAADLQREAVAYRRVVSRAARKQPERVAHRSFLQVVRRQPVCAIGCEA